MRTVKVVDRTNVVGAFGKWWGWGGRNGLRVAVGGDCLTIGRDVTIGRILNLRVQDLYSDVHCLQTFFLLFHK